MDLRRLKIEHSNAITERLAERMKGYAFTMKDEAVHFMDSGDEGSRASYDRAKISHDIMKFAIDTVQQVSREFEFKEDAGT